MLPQSKSKSVLNCKHSRIVSSSQTRPMLSQSYSTFTTQTLSQYLKTPDKSTPASLLSTLNEPSNTSHFQQLNSVNPGRPLTALDLETHNLLMDKTNITDFDDVGKSKQERVHAWLQSVELDLEDHNLSLSVIDDIKAEEAKPERNTNPKSAVTHLFPNNWL